MKIYRYAYITILTAFCLNCIDVKAQQKDILYFFKDVPQSGISNPALMPNNDLYISFGLGMFGFNFNTSGFCYHDIINRHPVYSDSLRVDIRGFADKLKDNNYLSFGFDKNILGFGFRQGKNHFSFDMYVSSDFRFNFSKDVFDFALYGTDVPGGETKLFDGKLLEMTTYLANSFGYAREINDKLTVGGRVKLLFGMADIHTKKSDVRLKYNDSDEIAAQCDVDIYTSNIVGSFIMNSLFDEDSETEFNAGEASDITSGMFSNVGLAFDLGAAYKINNEMEVSLSVSDMGFINWKSNVSEVKTMNPGKVVRFEGVESCIDSIGTAITDYLDDITDSLKNAFDIHAVDMNSYTRATPVKVNAGYTWKFADVHYLHALAGFKIWNGSLMDGRLSVLYALRAKYFSLSAGNTFMTTAFFNPSAMISTNAGPVHFNLGMSFNSAKGLSFNVADLSGVSVFMGLNLTFGNKPYWKENEKRNEISGNFLFR